MVRFYTAGENGRWSFALRSLERLVPLGSLCLHRSLADFAEALRGQAWSDPVVIFVDSDAELDQLAAVADRISRCRTLLVVHDDKPATFRKGHALRPRVLLSQPVDPEMIAAVLGKMLGDSCAGDDRGERDGFRKGAP